MRRVVVTGLGMVSPLGGGVEPTWKRILNSESGARKIEHFDVSDLTSQIACVVPRGDGVYMIGATMLELPAHRPAVLAAVVAAVVHPDAEARAATGTVRPSVCLSAAFRPVRSPTPPVRRTRAGRRGGYF